VYGFRILNKQFYREKNRPVYFFLAGRSFVGRAGAGGVERKPVLEVPVFRVRFENNARESIRYAG
jgi:hypothetical protein